MIANFPYIKIKNGTLAFVSNLEDMKYHFVGRSNAFIIFRQQVGNDPFEDTEAFENFIFEGFGYNEAQRLEQEIAF